MSVDHREARRPRVPEMLAVTTSWAWRLLVLAVVAYLMARLLNMLSVVTIPLIVALLVTALLTPVRDLFERAGLGRILASWATFLLAVAAFIGVLAFAVFQATRNASRLIDESSSTLDSIGRLLARLPLGLGERPLSALQDRFSEWITAHRSQLLSTAYSGANVTLHLLISVVVTAVLVFLLLYDGDHIWDVITRGTGRRWSARLHEAGGAAWRTISGYVHATLLIASFHGVVIGTTLALLHVPLAVVLAVLVFIGSFVPIAGALVAGGVAVLVALATGGLVDGAIVLGMLLLTNQVEAHLLQPLVMRRFVHVHPIVTVIGITALATVWGIPGALVAVPAAAVIHQVWPIVTGRAAAPGDPSPPVPDRGSNGRDAGREAGHETGRKAGREAGREAAGAEVDSLQRR